MERIWGTIPLRMRKFLLCCLALALSAGMVHSGYYLFTQQLPPIPGSAVFLVEGAVLVWLLVVLRRSRYRRTPPSLTLFFVALVVVLAVLAFAGLEPLSSYKDGLIDWFSERIEKLTQEDQSAVVPQGGSVPAAGTTPSIPINEPSAKSSTGAQVQATSPNVTQKESRIDKQQLEIQIHEATNVQRITQGRSRLVWDERLAAVTRQHSEDMATWNYFSHTNPEGLGPVDRCRRVGFPVREIPTGGNQYYLGCAENIFQCSVIERTWYLNGIPVRSDYRGEEEIALLVIEGWMESPGHRDNILKPYWQSQGIGVAIDSDGLVYVTQNFN